jgi:hypothetical protein
MEALIVASKIRPAEGVPVRLIRPQRGVIPRRVVKLAIMLRVIAKAVVSVACAIFGARTKAFMICSRDQRRNAVIANGRRWRRRSVVGSARRTASRKNTSGCNKRQGKSGEFHSVLTIQFAQITTRRAFE